MQYRSRAQKGFTLIELLVVVAIIGILASIIIPMFSVYSVRAYNAAARTDMRNFKAAMEAGNSDSQGYPDL